MGKTKNTTITWQAIIGIVSMVMLLIMRLFWGGESFWYDELHQMGTFLNANTLLDALMDHLTMIDRSAPLFTAAGYVWYRAVPLTQSWLMLFPQLLTCMGVFVLGLAAGQLSQRAGVIVSLLALVSYNLYYYAADELRPYSMLFLMVSIVLYLFIKRYRQGGDIKWQSLVLYGIALAALVLSHYLTILICLALFLMDVTLVLRKKARIYVLSSYILGALLTVPWAILAAKYSTTNLAEFWPKPPDLKSIKEVLMTFYGSSYLLLTVLTLAVISVVINWAADLKNRSFNGRHFVPYAMLLSAVTYIGFIFVYSRYVNPDGSIWVLRYFVAILPPSWVLMALYLDDLAGVFTSDPHDKTRKVTAIVTAIVCIAIAGIPVVKNAKHEGDYRYGSPFRQAADRMIANAGSDGDYVGYTLLCGGCLDGEINVIDGFDGFYLHDLEAFPLPAIAIADAAVDLGAFDTIYVIPYHRGGGFIPPLSDAFYAAFSAGGFVQETTDVGGLMRYVNVHGDAVPLAPAQ